MLRDQSRIPVGHLWIKEDANKVEYLAGVISIGVFGEIPIVVFKEDKRDRPNAPDYVIRAATSPNKDQK